MSDERAAGPKTEDLENRCDRMAAGIEHLFKRSTRVVEDCFASVDRNGAYRPMDFREIENFMKVGALLAARVAQLENAKNRKSKTQ